MFINRILVENAIKCNRNIACGNSSRAYKNKLDDFKQRVVRKGYSLEEMWEFGFTIQNLGYNVSDIELPIVFMNYKQEEKDLKENTGSWSGKPDLNFHKIPKL